MSFSKGIELIAAERQRQIEVEGCDAEHDSQYDDGELAFTACYYAMPKLLHLPRGGISVILYPEIFWPSSLDSMWAKRSGKSRIRQLAVAGALIAAEIDRFLAACRAGGENHDGIRI